MIRTIKIMTLCILTVLSCLTAGCGLVTRRTNIDAGMQAVEALDYDGALEYFNTAEAEREDMRLLYRGRGLCFMGKTDYAAAAEAFLTALSHSSGIPDDMDYDINYYLAAAYYKQGLREQAAAVYDAILALRKNEQDAYYLRGVIKTEQGDLESARPDFEQAIKLEGSTNERLIDIYGVLEQNGYKEIGQDYLRSAMDNESSGNKLSDFERGRICYYLEDYENARIYLERARSDSYQAVLFLGRTYEMRGDYNYAISVYNAYLEAGNESPQIYNQLGTCKMNMQEYDAALAAFQAGMKIEENDILQALRFNEIVAYEKLGDYRNATVLMEGYLQTYKDDAQAFREYEFLKTR